MKPFLPRIQKHILLTLVLLSIVVPLPPLAEAVTGDLSALGPKAKPDHEAAPLTWSAMAETLQAYADKGLSNVRGGGQAVTPTTKSGDLVRLNFDNAPLEEFVHAVLHDLLGMPYVVRAPLAGAITVRSETSLDWRQALAVLETMLGARGLLLSKSEDGVFYLDSHTFDPPRLAQPEQPVAEGELVVHALNFIAPSTLAGFLETFAGDHGVVNPVDSFGVIMLSGTSSQLSAWQSMIDVLDTDLLDAMSVGLYPVASDTPGKVAERLEFALNAGETQADDGSAKNAVRFIPLDWKNSLLVVSPNKAGLAAIEHLLGKIDPVDLLDFDQEVYLYPLLHALPHEVVHNLVELYGGDDFRVAVTENNAVAVYSSYRRFRELAKTLRLLDMPTRQVRVRLSVYEVSLVDELQYGVQWLVRRSLASGREETVRWLSGGSLDQVDGNGFLYSIRDSADGGRALVQALSAVSSVTLHSSPSLLIQSGHAGEVHIGEQVATLRDVVSRRAVPEPDPDQEPPSNQEPVDLEDFRGFEYRDTGLSLAVEARVGSSERVNLALEFKLTEVGPLENVGRGLDSYVFHERGVQTHVALRSGESLIIGGLIRENRATARARVPFLGRLPGVSHLLGTTQSNNRRTELLLVLTPEITGSDGLALY